MRARWVAVIGLVSACSKPHLVLPAVSPNMTPEQRVQMFQELHARRELTTTTTMCMRGCSTNVEKTMYLANGTEVYYPEDLLPVVASDSITARAVRNVHQQRRRSLLYGGIALASAIGIFAIWVSVNNRFQDRGEIDLSTFEERGLLVSGGGLLIGGFGTMYHQRQEVKYWGEANENYNTGLAQRLGVCTSGFAVVPCESVTPPPAMPPPAMPPMPVQAQVPAPAR